MEREATRPHTRATVADAIRLACLGSLLGLASCGDDAANADLGTDGGSAGTSAGAGGAGGSSTAGAGAGGTGVGGSGGASDAGAAGDSGAQAGTGDGGMADAGDQDAGAQSGPTVCRMPAPAQNPGNACPSADPVALALTPVAVELDVPVFATHAPGDASRLFVAERNGRILILDPDSGAEVAQFLDLQDAVATSSRLTDERGLLGMTFHPDYPRDPRFFVNYTTQPFTDLETVVASFEVSANDPNAADPSSEQVLMSFGQPAGNHNGGMVAFGPDGCLYVGSGDGGGSNDIGIGHAPEGNAQDLSTPLGKLLRIDVDDPESAAPGNLAGAEMPHIWDYGLRNPWRFSFDRATFDLYIGDVGQGAWEEIDVEPAGTGHKNYGWRIAEGNHCRPGGDANCELSAFEPAVDEYGHAGGDDCVVGGYVYRGSAIPSLRGWYVYGDNGPGRRIRAFVWDGQGRCGDRTIVLSERDSIALDADITSFGEDANGELYVSTSTAVYRIVAQ